MNGECICAAPQSSSPHGWVQFANALLGFWSMAAPSLLDHGDAARTNDLILGPFAATFAIIAIWDVSRPLGKANLLVGLWLALWVLGYDGWQSTFTARLPAY